MTAPAFYGIDPDVLYPWTPDEGKYDKNAEARKAAQEDAMAQADDEPLSKDCHLPIVMVNREGAPQIDLAPLSERMSLRVGALRQKQARLYLQARKRTTERLLAETAGKSEEEAKEIEERVTLEEIDALEDKASAIYTEEVQSAVLAECVKGWRNITGPKGEIVYSGDWMRDARCLPARWKAQIFYAIVTEAAWKKEEEESFTSQPE